MGTRDRAPNPALACGPRWSGALRGSSPMLGGEGEWREVATAGKVEGVAVLSFPCAEHRVREDGPCRQLHAAGAHTGQNWHHRVRGGQARREKGLGLEPEPLMSFE